MKGVGRLSINEIKKDMKETFANSESPNVMTVEIIKASHAI
jgi:hypothetical protein